jgi:hypothetical protein
MNSGHFIFHNVPLEVNCMGEGDFKLCLQNSNCGCSLDACGSLASSWKDD